MQSVWAATALAVVVAFAPVGARAETAVADIVANYEALAEAIYGDATARARDLDAAIDALLAAPTQDKLDAARVAWKAARVPYMQSEGFRFGNKIVDDWEGKVNAWPLDEGLIDYVDTASYGDSSDENPLHRKRIDQKFRWATRR
jgi:putative iron-regulated protein